MLKGIAFGLCLFVAGLLCLNPPSRAQLTMSGVGGGFGGAGFTPSCTESTNFIARTSGLDTTHKTNYDTLICGLVSDGDYTGLDVIYVWATDSTTNALLDLSPNARNGTVIGTPTSFTADAGYTGDGSTFAINSGFNPASAPTPQYVLNSGTIGICILSNITSGGSNATNVGASNVGESRIDAFFFGNTNYRINGPNKSASSATSQGQWISTRTAASGAGAVTLYRNGSTTPVDTDTAASDNVPFSPIYFFAINSGGVNSPTAAQMAFGFIGKGQTSTAMARVSARFITYMRAAPNSSTACG